MPHIQKIEQWHISGVKGGLGLLLILDLGLLILDFYNLEELISNSKSKKFVINFNLRIVDFEF